MSKSKFSEEQIIGFLKRAKAGMAVAEIGRRGGFSDATFYTWRSKFGGREASDAKRLRELEQKNAKLKRLLAEGTCNACAQERSEGKALAPQVKREAIGRLVQEHRLSERRARHLAGLSRDSYRHPPKSDAAMREQPARVVEVRRRFGYWHSRPLRRDFPGVSHKRVWRLYAAANLAVRKRRAMDRQLRHAMRTRDVQRHVP